MSEWRDLIVGARMTVDQEFAPRVAESQFSRQQWGLIMTAVEFEVEHPEDPERARIVADTSKLPAVMPELDDVDATMAGPAAAGGTPDRSGGILDGIKNLLGGDDGDSDEQRRAAAESLAQEYAAELQAHLESTGRWDEVRQAASH
ncbi:hypothetical protein BRC81_09270 [Halobacteriales archaeon QS_1_68_20]|nr:MAG: hypothetical protein BRC81_09270 [Halobacteriales archaeon QS_1_68_20]